MERSEKTMKSAMGAGTIMSIVLMGFGCSSDPNTISQREKMLDAHLSSSREMRRVSGCGNERMAA